MSNIFNSQGQLNANNMQDAFQQLAKFASFLEENAPSNLALAGQTQLDDNRRDQLVERAIMSQEGKIALAQAMANPIRRNLDYQGLARRALVVDPLTVAAVQA